MKTTHRDIEKLMPVATMMPTTAAASRCWAKKVRRMGSQRLSVMLTAIPSALPSV